MNRGVFYCAVVVLFVGMLFLIVQDVNTVELQPAPVVPVCPPSTTFPIIKSGSGDIPMAGLAALMASAGTNTISAFLNAHPSNYLVIDSANSQCATMAGGPANYAYTDAVTECDDLCGACTDTLRPLNFDSLKDCEINTEVTDSARCVFDWTCKFDCTCATNAYTGTGTTSGPTTSTPISQELNDWLREAIIRWGWD